MKDNYIIQIWTVTLPLRKTIKIVIYLLISQQLERTHRTRGQTNTISIRIRNNRLRHIIFNISGETIIKIRQKFGHSLHTVKTKQINRRRTFRNNIIPIHNKVTKDSKNIRSINIGKMFKRRSEVMRASSNI